MRRIIAPELRRGALQRLFKEKKIVRAIEAHNGLSAIIANDTSIMNDQEKREFDVLWVSSFTDSAAKGQPDADIVSLDSRIMTVDEIAYVTTKPILVDGDTGGTPDTCEAFVRKLYALGVSGVVLEDQLYPKRNSLDHDITHRLEDPTIFAQKISHVKSSCPGDDFFIFARIESFIAGFGVGDALYRAKKYLEAGADGILIHSKKKTPDEIFSFAQGYENLSPLFETRKPLVCVPTTYNTIHEEELALAGFNLVIYANHQLRAAHRAMDEVIKVLLNSGKASAGEAYCTSVGDIHRVVGFDELKKRQQNKTKVIIPTGGKHTNLGDLCTTKPCSLLPFGEKTVLEHQLNELKKTGITEVVVIRGTQKEKINFPKIRYYDADTQEKGIVASLFSAENEFNDDLIILWSDILFTYEIIEKVLAEKDNMVVVIDSTCRLPWGRQGGGMDYVVTTERAPQQLHKSDLYITRAGRLIPITEAGAELIGITYLSKNGAEYLRQLYHECKNVKGPFHEASSFENASLTDLLQESIDRGCTIKAIEVRGGWRELHTPEDYEKALQEMKKNP